MSTDYQTTYDAKAGYSLVLTIDEVIQYYLEQSLDQALTDTGREICLRHNNGRQNRRYTRHDVKARL